MADEICTCALLTEGNLFEELLASVRFEEVGKGRRGSVLTRFDEAGAVPLVRSTNCYSAPAQCFRPVHERLAWLIQQRASLQTSFNNALIETYTNAYTTMGSHSDQALDLADDSFIAVFSCYEHPEIADPPRQLCIESKEASWDLLRVPLTHHGVVVFSVAANRRFRHKIVLDKYPRMPENRWLGITYRTSKTFVRFRGGSAYFPDDARLILADDNQRREFYRLRSRENNESDFAYPRITYTISESDLMPPQPG